MPSYDYRCENCKRHVLLTYKTYADYDKATPTCPNCQSTSLTRIITRVAIAKSESSRFSNIEDEAVMDDLANADPATLGRYMRRMSSEVGEDLGDEFNEVVDRLERGQDPADIEAALPSSLGDSGDALGSGLSDSAID